MHPFLNQIWSDLLQLIYPALCAGCPQALTPGEELLCTRCRMALPLTNQHLTDDPGPASKFAGKVPVVFVWSYLSFAKKGTAQRLIHQLKYNGKKEIGQILGRWYGFDLMQRPEPPMADLLISVPLHSSRERQRGYNQSEWISLGLSEAMGIPHRKDVLRRTTFKASQTRKSRLERWKNVETVFNVSEPQELAGKRIILVDDVLTTGATLEACTIELLRAGCASVGILTIAATR